MNDETLTELIHVVRGDFSIPEGEGTVVLQQYDESWSEWLDVTDETELEDRAKIKVVLLGKKEDASEETKSQAVEPTKMDAGMFLFLCMFLFYIFKNQQMYVFNRLGISWYILCLIFNCLIIQSAQRLVSMFGKLLPCKKWAGCT